MGLDIFKYFNESFGVKCIMSYHAQQRIKERFLGSELSKLKLLIQASLKKENLESWNHEEPTVLVDPRFNFSILCSYNADKKEVKIITFIRGKTPESYKDCKVINVSIMKEQAEQEVMAFKNQTGKRKII